MADVRVSKITKGIEKVFNIGKYESIRISVHAEEDITWETLEERQKKTDSVTKVLLMDFEKTRDEVMEALGVSEKKAFGNNKEKESTSLTASESKELFDTL